MSQAFVALQPKCPSTPDGSEPFRVKIVSGTDAAPGATFRPLAFPQAPPAAHAAGEHSGVEPKLTVRREGGRITSLRIECSCGEIMDIPCVYE